MLKVVESFYFFVLNLKSQNERRNERYGENNKEKTEGRKGKKKGEPHRKKRQNNKINGGSKQGRHIQ